MITSHDLEIIAEIGVNHNGCMETAQALIQAAAESGAHYAKFQSYTSSRLVSPDLGQAEYQKKNSARTETQHEMLVRYELASEDYGLLTKACEENGIKFLSSAFDRNSLRFLVEDLGLGIVKIGSGELLNLPMLLELGRLQVQVILSTGMALLSDIELALSCLAFGAIKGRAPRSEEEVFEVYSLPESHLWLSEHVSLLHCTTSYPAPPSGTNLRVLPMLSSAFGLRVGFSDHTPGAGVAHAAIALGATIIEKHMTLDNNMPGPDHKASMEPPQFRELVEGCKDAVQAMGHSRKFVQPSEIGNKALVQKRLVAACDIAMNEPFTVDNVLTQRRYDGLPAGKFLTILGTKSRQDIPIGMPILER